MLFSLSSLRICNLRSTEIGHDNMTTWQLWKSKTQNDEDTKWWKMDLVRSIFLPHEAATILKILISFRLPDDQLVWIGNKRGSFTVKSAYYIAMRMVDDQEFGECSAVHSQTSFWKVIWHLNIPPKIRIFAWRVCKNGLPTMLNLRSRGLNISGFCLLCDKEMESV